MPTLAGFSGRGLAPDLTQSLNLALQTFGTKQERDIAEAERAKQAEIAKQVELTIPQPGADPAAQRSTEEAALLRLGVLNPEIARVTRDTLTSGDVAATEALQMEAETGARNAAFVTGQPDFASKQRAITTLAQDAAAQGKPLDRFIELQNMNEDELGLELQRMKLAAQDIKTVLTPTEQFVPVMDAAGNIIGQKSTTTQKVVPDPRAQAAPKPTTTIGKARADLKGGLITQADFDTIKSTPKKFQSPVGKLIEDKQVAVSAFGADSPEVLVIDRAITAASKGKPIKPDFQTFVGIDDAPFDIDINTPEGAALATETIAAGGRKATPQDKKITPDQRKAAGFSVRIENASKIIDALGGQFTGAEALAGSRLPNFMKSSDRQKFEQSQRNFINAVLRRESGAAIAPSEFESAALQYFPQPGDSEAVLAQKKGNRKTVSAALDVEAGRAAEALREALKPQPVKEGQTATNHTTGEQMIFRDGQWQPL